MSSRVCRAKPRITKPNDEYAAISQEETLNSRYETRSQNEQQASKSKEEIEDEEDNIEPVWTFRVLFLGLLSFIFLIIITKYCLRETAECLMSMMWAMLVVYPIGLIMAKKLPKRKIYLRPIGLEFALNPGSFNKKEYVLISIIGNIGAVYGGLTSDFILNTPF